MRRPVRNRFARAAGACLLFVAGCGRVGFGGRFAVQIEQAPGQSDPARSLPIVFTVELGRALPQATVTAAMVEQAGSAPGVTWAWEHVAAASWRLRATASGGGTIIPVIREAAFRVGEHYNAASSGADNVVTYLEGCAGGLGCAAGYLCSAGVCVGGEGTACADNRGCAEVCIAGTCGPLSGGAGPCDESPDCASGYACAGQICLGADGTSCTANSECVEACIDSLCGSRAGTGGACDEGADCQSGHSCVAGACRLDDGQSCSANSACLNTCIGGACAPGSAAGGPCDVGDAADCLPGNSCGAGVCQSSTPSGPAGFVSVVAGILHSCGLTAGGAAYCWGSDFNGQLGNGAPTAQQPTPSPVDTSGISGNKAFIALVAAGYHTCGLTADRAAYCWGRNAFGQLGYGPVGVNSASPSPVDTSSIAGNKAFMALAAGDEHTCGLTVDGVAYCWGMDTAGQLGNAGITGNQVSPSPVDTTGIPDSRSFIILAAGASHTCGLTAERVPYCWGSDAGGQLGNGAPTGAQASPSLVDTSGISGNRAFVALTASLQHTCGRAADGVAYCWGDDLFLQLGNGATTGVQASPSPVDTTSIPGNKAFVLLAAGWSHTCGLTGDGVSYCWGGDGNGTLGNGGITGNQASPSPVDAAAVSGNQLFVSLAAGSGHVCGVTIDGVTYCWGDDGAGQLGDDSALADQPSPVPVDTTAVAASTAFSNLVAGSYQTCGLSNGRAYCWGSDGFGLLGNGTVVGDQSSPSLVDATVVTGNQAFVAMAAGWAHTCGLTADRVPYCWGYDNAAQLGNGAVTADQPSPSPVDTSVIAGNKAFLTLVGQMTHSCGLTADGVAYCWGEDVWSELGNGALTGNQASPSPVDTTTIIGNKLFVELATGEDHTCGLTVEGVAYCWGRDAEGQLGNGAPTAVQASPSPVDTTGIAGNRAFVRLAAGGFHTCGLTVDGVAYCWGSDNNGELGDAAAGNQSRPSAVDTSVISGNRTLVDLVAGRNHTCGLAADGAAYCWGWDGNGQLGNGGAITLDQLKPSLVDTSGIPGNQAFVSLTAAWGSTCGLTADAAAYCWGWDVNGQLGNGAVTGYQASPSAVDVSGL